MRLEEAQHPQRAMRDMLNALVFCIVVLAIFDTLSFSGHYRKVVWQQVAAQAVWATADIR